MALIMVGVVCALLAAAALRPATAQAQACGEIVPLCLPDDEPEAENEEPGGKWRPPVEPDPDEGADDSNEGADDSDEDAEGADESDERGADEPEERDTETDEDAAGGAKAGGFVKKPNEEMCLRDETAEQAQEDGSGPRLFIPFPGSPGTLIPVPKPSDIPDGDFVDNAIDLVIGKMFGREGEVCLQSSVLRALISIPDYTGSELKRVATSTSSAALGLLGATMTFAIIHFYLSGLTLFGGQALQSGEGIRRAVGAAIFIALWPWLFDNVVAVANVTAAAVLTPDVQDMAIRTILKVFFISAAIPALPFILALMFGLAGIALVLALFMLKVAMGAVLTVIFVSMPIVAALWVLPSLAWIARIVIKAFTVVLGVPLIWALCFAAFAAVGTDAFRFSELDAGLAAARDERDSSLITLLIDPLVAFMLLLLLLAIPKMFISVITGGIGVPGIPGMGGGGGGGAGGTLTDAGKTGLQMKNQKDFQAGMLQNQKDLNVAKLGQQANFDQAKLGMQGEQNQNMANIKKEQGEASMKQASHDRQAHYKAQRQENAARNAPAKAHDGIPFTANQKKMDREWENMGQIGVVGKEDLEHAHSVMDAHGVADAVRAFDHDRQAEYDRNGQERPEVDPSFQARMAEAAGADKLSPELQEAFRVTGASTSSDRAGLYQSIDAARDDAAYDGGRHRAPSDEPQHDSYLARHADLVAAAPHDPPHEGKRRA